MGKNQGGGVVYFYVQKMILRSFTPSLFKTKKAVLEIPKRLNFY